MIPQTTLDLDAYFQRIGYTGDRTPTLKTLQGIHYHHAKTIAFENLNPLVKQPVLLDLPSLQQKLIYGGRGGYCFEQNSLLRSVLLAIGFQVTNLAARVLWNVPAGLITPRSHMVLRVELEEESHAGESYIVDVGFGGLTLTTPLLLAPDLEQHTSHEPFRLIVTGLPATGLPATGLPATGLPATGLPATDFPVTHQTYTMQANLNQEWKSLYQFDLQQQQLPDYEVSSWYASTHPKSLFVNSLIVAKPDTDCRYALQNNHLTTHYLDGRTERRTLKTVQELRSVLEEVFGLQVGAIDNLDSALNRFIEPTT